LRTTRGMKMIALAAVGGLALFAAACSKPASNPTTGQSAGTYKACMVTDTGGIDDRSFNASSWAGLEAAKAQNSKIATSYTASTAMSDYNPNLTNSVSKGCQYIQAVGGLMAADTKKVATANPKVQFAIVDADNQGLANIFPIQFETQQAAYLAGYLAAVGVVVAGGLWSSVWTWRHRAAKSHTVSLLVLTWGLVLGAIEVLPRIGYAKPDANHPATWVCQ